MVKFLAGTALSLIALPLWAEPTLSIPLPLTEEISVLPMEYTCADGEPLKVKYVNAGDNRLAILPIDGTERIFVNVISASGARYVAGEYEWWSKGDTASLTNQLEDQSAQECQSRE